MGGDDGADAHTSEWQLHACCPPGTGMARCTLHGGTSSTTPGGGCFHNRKAGMEGGQNLNTSHRLLCRTKVRNNNKEAFNSILGGRVGPDLT